MMHFRVNTPNVVLEAFEDEVVVVNLENGNYYTTDGVGADIWGLLDKVSTKRRIVEAIGKKYRTDSEEMESAVHRFLDELMTEGLLVSAENPASASDPGPDQDLQEEAETARPVFQPPVLHRYTDMQDLLLLDPIHEVDESGWPAMKSDSPPGQS